MLYLLPVCVFILLGLAFRAFNRKKYRLPPGPSMLPFIGNAHHIPSQDPQVAFAKFRHLYGDVSYLSIFGKPIVVLNSLKACQDLLDKRSAIYSDRPDFPSFEELGWVNVPTQMGYGRRFRRQRQMIQNVFNRHGHGPLHEFRNETQSKEAKTLLSGFLQDPDKFRNHIHRYAAAAIVNITYGRTVSSVDDEYVQLAEEAGRLTIQSTSTPAAAVLDTFPSLRSMPSWVPVINYKRDFAAVRATVETMINLPYTSVIREMARPTSGDAPLCFTSFMRELYSSKMTPEIEDDIRSVAGAMYVAAVDTTSAVLETFMLAMVLHPHILKKAQEEIDRTIGSERLIELSDRATLPYIENLLKECYRWNPPIPLALPHKVMEDDEYNGFHIPKSSTIIANVFGILNDCSNPGVFLPERYEDESAIDPKIACFGFGRRICPGRHFADDGIWFIIANTIALFDILKRRNLSGEEVTPALEFETGFVRHPKPFSCAIKPRSGKSADLLSKLAL